MSLPNVLINGQKLSEAQAITFRLAFSFIDSNLNFKSLEGVKTFDHEHRVRLSEIKAMIQHKPMSRTRVVLTQEQLDLRNIAIYNAVNVNGESVESQAEKYNLNISTIKKIILRHEIELMDQKLESKQTFDVTSLKKDPSLLIQPVSILKLTARASNALVVGDIYTIGELINKTDADLRKIPNMGNTSICEIKRALSEFKLTLK